MKEGYIKRATSTIPFGYELSEKSSSFLRPIEDQLVALSVAEYMVKNDEVSLRDAADWLYAETNRYISHVGLKKYIDKKIEKNGS
tara:strand:+ start:828 stop:1082 length:255 start_codon:yes stop_codon:yes gene_type:complete